MPPVVILPPPSMPTGLLIALSLASLLVAIGTCVLTNSLYVRALALTFWFRYLLSAWHQITFKPTLGGLSLNALGSCTVIGLIVVMLGHRSAFSRYAAPFVWLLGAIAVSAIVNGSFAGGINATIKVIYLICVAHLAYYAMLQKGLQHTMTAVAASFALPLSMQWTSVAIGLRKATEQDGSASYIGGFAHEAAFSIMIVTFLFAAVFLRRSTIMSMFILLLGLVSLFLANYRTSILSIVPVLLYFVTSSTVARIRKDQRAAAAAVTLLVSGITIVLFVALNADRFIDIATGLQKGADLFKPSEWYTREERLLFSGRTYIWSQYLTAWLRGSTSVILFGYGPDAWQGRFTVYAHNTFVSYIYEYGLLGLCGIGVLFATYMKRAFGQKGDQSNLLAASAVGFLILNLATMPLWQVEGNLLFAILLAHVWYVHASERASKQRPERMVSRPLQPSGSVAV